jgi:hypothetical protein
MRSWVRSIVGLMLVMGFVAPVMAGQTRLLDRLRDRSTDRDEPKETEVVDRTIAFPANGTLVLKNFSGDIRITPANGRNEIVLKATRRASREVLDHIKLDVATSGATVTIDANKCDGAWNDDRRNRNNNNNVVETRMELQVPASADLDIDVFSSEIFIEGMAGDQRIKTFSGEINVRDLRGEIEAETFSGDINVTLPGNAKGSVTFDSFSGALDTAIPISTTSTGGRRRNNRLEGTLPGGSGPRMRFQTFSGDVILKTR